MKFTKLNLIQAFLIGIFTIPFIESVIKANDFSAITFMIAISINIVGLIRHNASL